MQLDVRGVARSSPARQGRPARIGTDLFETVKRTRYLTRDAAVSTIARQLDSTFGCSADRS